ncbi:hypothetical protein [Novosphingobium sp.]|uniref:hypothetical protein n=1 Tax=Novosphingobium sp. TaxID=1874826 RepID=UPI00286DF0C6|nr:hypothetical protein [Novosphingobium sp.]
MQDSDEGTGIDPVLAVLIAQLHRNGTLDSADVANMQRRLIEGGNETLADGLAGVILSDMIDDPAMRRASIHVLPDGER